MNFIISEQKNGALHKHVCMFRIGKMVISCYAHECEGQISCLHGTGMDTIRIFPTEKSGFPRKTSLEGGTHENG